MEANQTGKNFWTDLTTFQKWFLVIFVLGSVFSFFTPLFMGGPISELFSFTAIIGLICAITGVLTSIYQARGEVIVYAFIIVNTVTYAWIAYASDLYGQVIQNLILLLPIQIYGLISWKNSAAKSENNQIEIKVFTAKKWMITIVCLFVFWGIYYVFLNHLPQIIHTLFGGKEIT